MNNDLIELTHTELDAVTGGGGKGGMFSLNFGNIVTQTNEAEESAAIVNMGSNTASTNGITLGSISQSNSSSIVGGSPSFGSFRFF